MVTKSTMSHFIRHCQYAASSLHTFCLQMFILLRIVSLYKDDGNHVAQMRKTHILPNLNTLSYPQTAFLNLLKEGVLRLKWANNPLLL